MQPPLYYAASAQTYQPHHVAPQHFMMPPPPYSSTAPSYNMVIPVAPITHQQTDTSAGMRPPPMFHNVATAPTGYTVPMGHQVCITSHCILILLFVFFLNKKNRFVLFSSIPIQTAIFDAGARFNGKAPVIPPPPPGYLPNAAQVAAMQGQSVKYLLL